MDKQKLCAAALLACLSGWTSAQAPQVSREKIEAGYCHRQNVQRCAEATLRRLIFSDPAHTKYADGLITRNLKGLEAPTQQALEKWVVGKAKEQPDTHDIRSRFTSENMLIGYTPAYEVLAQDYYEDSGGPQGSGKTFLHVLNRRGEPKKLNLQDIVLPGKMQRLQELQKQAWTDYLKSNENMDDAKVAAHLKQFAFKATDNWSFDPGGLGFLFQPDDIGPHSMGRPALVLPVKELESVIKPEILKEAMQYRELNAPPEE